MTPKEKAKELIHRFMRYTPAEVEYELPYAKQCAIIAVDEVLNALSPYGSKYKYWLEVKQEIEKL